MVHLSGPSSWTDLWTILASIAAVLVASVPFFLKKVIPAVRRRRERREAMHVAIVGSPPVVDRATGKQRAPAVPGIAERMETMETHMAVMARTVASLNDAHERLDGLDERIQTLEDARVERVVSQAESAQMWRAVADNNMSGEDEG